MMIFDAYALLPFLANALATASPALPACQIEQSTTIEFSGGEKPDTLTVAVHGDPCWDATATITIRSSGGKELYHYQQRYKTLTAVDWRDPELPKDAARFVRGTIDDGTKLARLPEWLPPDEFYEANHANVAITREYYESLRKLDLPVFYHLTYYEGGVELVFDPGCQCVVAATSGGL